ncbi:hypothetical protein NQ318_016941 [Aromia moschata]|uniref:Uncharacterized protein n=1 Tax=Aromia moschata TaxID=1265417 RepID=A0AAV8XQH2_9CUCU|nr:hypothetical protein NQ318_016941 [Aromia moschata]
MDGAQDGRGFNLDLPRSLAHSSRVKGNRLDEFGGSRPAQFSGGLSAPIEDFAVIAGICLVEKGIFCEIDRYIM